MPPIPAWEREISRPPRKGTGGMGGGEALCAQNSKRLRLGFVRPCSVMRRSSGLALQPRKLCKF